MTLREKHKNLQRKLKYIVVLYYIVGSAPNLFCKKMFGLQATLNDSSAGTDDMTPTKEGTIAVIVCGLEEKSANNVGAIYYCTVNGKPRSDLIKGATMEEQFYNVASSYLEDTRFGKWEIISAVTTNNQNRIEYRYILQFHHLASGFGW